MYDSLIKLTLGIILLLVSTKTLIKLAEKLSASFKISPLIIGMTIVAIGTSLPELAVSGIASARGDFGLAVGNIVGSNIVNILLVLPVGIMLGKIRIGTTKTQRNTLILLAATAFYITSYALPSQSFYIGILFITISLFLTIVEYDWAVTGRGHEDKAKMSYINKEGFTLWKLFALGLSVTGIILGGFLTVTSVENISLITGYSTTVLGLTLTAIATSLPELLATIFAQEEHQEKITLGNVMGSNIYNLLLIGGIIKLFSPSAILPFKDWFMLAFATIIFAIIVRRYRGEKIPKWISFILLAIYILWLVIQTAAHIYGSSAPVLNVFLPQ